MIIINIFRIVHFTKNIMQYIDFRSDTVSQPTEQMRKEILTAQIGDHTYGEDPNVVLLEKMAAEIVGKQAASFVPTGCFGNQCAILTASQPGAEIILPDKSHLIDYQYGSVGSISRMLTRTVPTDQDMLMPVQEVKKFIRKVKDSQAPKTLIFEIENPTGCGSVYPMQHFNELIDIALQEKLHIHYDGARIFNACHALNIKPTQLTKNCSSVMFCLSKGLCCPIGSIVAGSKQFITKFNVYRKMLGGVMRKPGMFARMGIIALNDMVKHLADDHRIAKLLTQQLKKVQWITLVKQPQTNMVFIRINDKRIRQCEKNINDYLWEKKNIKSAIIQNKDVASRFVIHHYIREKEIKEIISGLKEFFVQNISS